MSMLPKDTDTADLNAAYRGKVTTRWLRDADIQRHCHLAHHGQGKRVSKHVSIIKKMHTKK